jgi:predicted O-methyltransferase YrrM
LTSSPPLTEIVAAVADVEGWMTPAQAARLWRCAAAVPDGGRIVEIGSFRGRSLIVLTQTATEAGEIVSIDPHAGTDRGPLGEAGREATAAADHEAYRANLAAAGVLDRVRHVRKFSSDALDDVTGPVDLLYIDGAHQMRPALDDIRRWGAKVAPGGTMLIHDSFSSVGVTLAISRSLLVSRTWRYQGRSGSLTEYRKVGGGSLGEVLGSTGRQLAALPWFARNLVVKALMIVGARRLTRFLGHDGQTWPY